MQRSSETIGAIAAALAKAQAELANPEKSLTATIRASHPRESEQTFKYATLSSGLDIVRKALGGHEIATVQTTAIDKEAGLIRLTTTLAHSSGEWLSSEWPVCGVTETAAPRRMGAALTYARRYALFTLVEIAGEDDLDAPDLNDGDKYDGGPVVPRAAMAEEGWRARDLPNGVPAARTPAQARAGRNGKGDKGKSAAPPRVVLGAEASAELRDRLVGEVAGLRTADEAAQWVHRTLPLKNTLTLADARQLEGKFKQRLVAFEATPGEGADAADAAPSIAGEIGSADSVAMPAETTGNTAEAGLFMQDETIGHAPDLANPAIAPPPRRRRVAPKTIRLRDKEHCKFVARQPCIVCGRTPSEAHHLRFAQPRALGRKVSDEFTVPVCRTHHRELHRYGDEASWWVGVNVEPVTVALQLWRRSHPNNSEPSDDAPASRQGFAVCPVPLSDRSLNDAVASNFSISPETGIV